MRRVVKRRAFRRKRPSGSRQESPEQLAQWEIGENDLAICGGACEADTLFAEECLRRGARLRLLLAQEGYDLSAHSVSHAGEEMGARRFHALCEKAEVAILSEQSNQQPDSDLLIYARTNLWIINSAQEEAADPGKIYAPLVWDEKPTGDGPAAQLGFPTKNLSSWRTNRNHQSHQVVVDSVI